MFFIIIYDDEIRQFLFTILNATNIVIIFLISKLFRTFFSDEFHNIAVVGFPWEISSLLTSLGSLSFNMPHHTIVGTLMDEHLPRSY